MSDVLLIVILVAFFAFAIALVQVLGRMIDRGTDPEDLDVEPSVTGGEPVGPDAEPRSSLDASPGGSR